MGGSPIARTVAAAFGRDQVTQYLAAITLNDTARKALQEAGLELVDVRVTNIDAPREAHLTIAAAPAETPCVRCTVWAAEGEAAGDVRGGGYGGRRRGKLPGILH
ncbi:hypothetical protein [Streptomyces sp. NBC_00091]|uniref:hypothetical protein n=1 Tax=Streptomyces sp. NBC_00091 TaxID=2975648 RepID=UPI002252D30F|nr:hypothetical protein [Streptomyces sp. NBC_00091]MCX5374920.1 hypothetical protein [Streptomyces sp. NBC_00091]MCX5380247.1 hypothetical protein [Streptomyces sp. NBC_00091]